MTLCTSSLTPSHSRRVLLKLGTAIAAMMATGNLRAQANGGVVKVAAVFNTPLDQPWVARVHEALMQAQQRGEIDYVYAENVAKSAYEKTLREHADAGAQLIVSAAFQNEQRIYQVAKDYPNIAFLVGSSDRPQQSNVAVFDNHIHEPTYLTGMVAGGMSQTGIISLIAGYPIPRTNRLLHAFMDGAREINPDAKFLVTFIQTWFGPVKARQAAFTHIDQGADVLYAERLGVAEAARERGKLIVGSNIDMKAQYPDTVIASAIWEVGPTIERALTMVKRGTFKADDYGKYSQMRYQGAALSSLGTSERKIPTALIALVQARHQTILDGSFTIKLNDAPLAPTS